VDDAGNEAEKPFDIADEGKSAEITDGTTAVTKD
jgi:hypothetical protein